VTLVREKVIIANVSGYDKTNHMDDATLNKGDVDVLPLWATPMVGLGAGFFGEKGSADSFHYKIHRRARPGT